MNANNQVTRDASYSPTADAFFLPAKEGASIPEQFPCGLGAIILDCFLYQSEIVPRWLSAWGLVGGALMIGMGFIRMFGYLATFSFKSNRLTRRLLCPSSSGSIPVLRIDPEVKNPPG